MKHQFAQLTNDQIAALVGMHVDSFIITKEDADEVKRVLGLDGMDPYDLTSVRNTVVMTFASLTDFAREQGMWSLYDQLHNNMSGAVAVIDHMIYS